MKLIEYLNELIKKYKNDEFNRYYFLGIDDANNESIVYYIEPNEARLLYGELEVLEEYLRLDYEYSDGTKSWDVVVKVNCLKDEIKTKIFEEVAKKSREDLFKENIMMRKILLQLGERCSDDLSHKNIGEEKAPMDYIEEIM